MNHSAPMENKAIWWNTFKFIRCQTQRLSTKSLLPPLTIYLHTWGYWSTVFIIEMCNSQHFRSLLPAALKVVNEISDSSYNIQLEHANTHTQSYSCIQCGVLVCQYTSRPTLQAFKQLASHICSIWELLRSTEAKKKKKTSESIKKRLKEWVLILFFIKTLEKHTCKPF